MTGRVCIIANAGSGRKKADRIRAVTTALSEALGQPAELRLVRDGRALGAAARTAAEAGFAVVVAAGGDGTVAAVADAVAGREVALGALPLGTFNFFTRGLGLPEDPVAAAQCLGRAIVAGQMRALDVAEVNGKVFLNNASLGLYPAILAGREMTYARWGRSRLAAYWSVLRVLLSYSDAQWLRLSVDGVERQRKTPSAFVAASAYQLDHYGLHGAEILREGRLALFVAPDASRWRMAAIALRLALKRANPYEDFELLGGEEIVIGTRRPRRTVAHDGEYDKMPAPFRFAIRRGGLRVVVPAPASVPAPDPAVGAGR